MSNLARYTAVCMRSGRRRPIWIARWSSRSSCAATTSQTKRHALVVALCLELLTCFVRACVVQHTRRLFFSVGDVAGEVKQPPRQGEPVRLLPCRIVHVS